MRSLIKRQTTSATVSVVGGHWRFSNILYLILLVTVYIDTEQMLDIVIHYYTCYMKEEEIEDGKCNSK